MEEREGLRLSIAQQDAGLYVHKGNSDALNNCLFIQNECCSERNRLLFSGLMKCDLHRFRKLQDFIFSPQRLSDVFTVPHTFKYSSCTLDYIAYINIYIISQRIKHKDVLGC